ncbi:MAG TPA: hypothetical protein DDW30_01135 [Clostridiales bacterium]|nr:hypothetical protein [Clostridiales bacterium]
MKGKKRWAVVLLLLFVGLLSCTGKSEGEQASADTTAEEAFLLFDGSSIRCSIVIPKYYSDAEYSAAKRVRALLKSLTGIQAELQTDDAEVAADSYELLIGSTDRPVTRELKEALSYGDYAVQGRGRELALFSWSEQGLMQATDELERLVRDVVCEKSKTIALASDINRVGTAVEWELPKYSGGDFRELHDCGDGAYMAYFANSDAASLARYVNSLAAEGYTISTHSLGDNVFYELNKARSRCFAYYTAAFGEVRMLRDVKPEVALQTPQSGSAETALFTSLANDKAPYVLCLSDNSLVIFDGHVYSDRDTGEQVRTFYRELVHICGSEEIRITAWFLSHAHADHTNMLNRLLTSELADKLTLERVICNVASSADMGKLGIPDEVANYGNYTAVLRNVQSYNRQYRKEAAVIKTHTGEVFRFGGVTFEILYTHEDYLPRAYPIGGSFKGNGANSHSLVMRMTYGEKVVLWTGDMSDEMSEIVEDMYGNALKCDIVQVGHHGNNTCGKPSFYLKCDPDILLWTWDQRSFEKYVLGLNRAGARVYEALASRVSEHIFLAGDAVRKVSLE